MATTQKTNTLHYGDCLDILKAMPAESVDLIYLDPPFNSNANYNMLFGSERGEDRAQLRAFEDTWSWHPEYEEMYIELLTHGGTFGDTVEALRTVLGPCGMLAYLLFMMQRLVEMRRVLQNTGSIYLHCDPTASHYLKIVMDAIFGASMFKNEVVWHYTGGGRSKNYFSRKHDIIFWYSKGGKHTFNIDAVRVPYKDSSGYAKGGITSASGKHYMPNPDGTPVDDVWDIPIINPMSKERLGYPTQKPLKLLDRIIKASSIEGDVVLDPFCGCGTTVDAAEALGRRWIGIDISALAIDIIRERLDTVHGKSIRDKIEINGIPRDVEGARKMFEKNKGKGSFEGAFEFEHWAVGLIRGRPNEKQGADGGSDGTLFFPSSDRGKPQRGVIQIKGGQTINPDAVDRLEGVVSKTRASMGVLITLKTPSKGMVETAAKYGLWEDEFTKNKFPRIQIITVGDLLDGKRPNMPTQLNPYNQAEYRHNGNNQEDML